MPEILRDSSSSSIRANHVDFPMAIRGMGNRPHRLSPNWQGRSKYAVVAVDYFTKWTEAEPLATITSKKFLDFVVKNIICRYGMPRKIVSDNRTQFDSDLFTNFCEKNGIIKSFSSVTHPQANGQVKVVNKLSRVR